MTGTQIELLLGLMVCVGAIALIAERLRVPYPILLVLAGTAIGFIPNLPREHIVLDPDLVFVLFLPPLLYYAGFMTTWRDFVANREPIALLAVGLVLATTAAVAYVAHWMIPAMPLAAAFVLGAIVSPPDAIAATAITQRLQVPRRVVTVLEGESLVNDATALVAYSLAVLAVKTGTFSFTEASWKFVLLSLGGAGMGLIAGWIVAKLHKLVHEPHVEAILSLLTPYIAYLPAEWCHVSGVLAAVAAGIYMSRQAPRVFSANSRVSLTNVWDTLVFLANGFVFILIGLQLPAIAESLSQIRWPVLIKYGIVISLVAIFVRIAWVFATAYLRRAVRGQGRCVPWDQVTVVSWAGMRGIVSLAAALALPMYLDPSSKTPFPQRDLIIYLAFSVILATLVFQGLTLAPLIRMLRLAEDQSEKKEEWEARLDAAHTAVARLQVLALEEGLSDECMAKVREEYSERIARLGALRRGGGVNEELEDAKDLHRIRREALIAERRMITLLRDQNIIGDEVLRRVIRDIDLAEARLS